MLRQFTVNNFKSLINITYEPGAINLLIGVNNSGKTNFCQALCLLSQTARRQEALSRNWPAANVYFDHPTVDLGCTCELSEAGETLTFHYSLALRTAPPMGLVTEQLQISGGPFGSGNTVLLENEAGRVRLLNEEQHLSGKSVDDCYQSVTTYNTATALSFLNDRQANQRAIAFRDHLAAWQYYDLEPRRLRDDRFDPQADVLSFDGANLASVLFNLKNRDERRYRRLIELAQKLDRRLDALNFTTFRERIQMELTDTQDHRFSPASASSGTLRFMALCYIILNNTRQSNPPLTIIEEPENGLYVRYLKPLFELIDPMGSSGQYIFTAHSPYFIDLFDGYLENITLMKDRETYSALLKPDPARLRQYLADMPLGELHFREMLT